MENNVITVSPIYTWKFSEDQNSTFCWMINDLWRGIQTKSNYLVALGLMAYSEAIGWVILNESNKDGFKCFDEFTRNYVQVDPIDKDTFDKVRNGLAHRYFGKKSFLTISHATDGESKSIVIIGNQITIYVNNYFKNFVKGVEKYLDQNPPATGPIGVGTSTSFFGSHQGATGPNSI